MPWIDANGISIRYNIAGHGAPIVLFHELGGCVESWASVVHYLSPDFTTLSYDQRGAGLSEKVREPFTFDTLVADFEALIGALDVSPPFHLFGIAAGAALALLVADRHPEWTTSLILCNPAVRTSAQRTEYSDMRAAAAEQLGMRAIVPLTLGRSFPPHTASDPASYAQYLARYLACDPRGFALMSAALARNTSAQTLSRIRCRTLVLAGRDDTVRPSSETISVAGEIPGAQHAVIDGGHFMHVAQPDALTAAIGAFLRV